MAIDQQALLENAARHVATFAGIDVADDERLLDHWTGSATQPDQRLANAVSTAEEILLPAINEISSLEHAGSIATQRYVIATQRLTQLDEYIRDMASRLPGDMSESFYGREFYQWLQGEIEQRPQWNDQGGAQS